MGKVYFPYFYRGNSRERQMIASLKKRIGEILDPAETADALSRG